MNSRTNLLLMGGLLLLVAVLVFNQGDESTSIAPDSAFIPELIDDAGSINSVTITGPGTELLATIQRDGDDWVVAERNGYPADLSKLSALIRSLSQAQIVETKTANPEFHNRLGVEDIEDEEAAGVLIGIKGDGLDVNLILGDTASTNRYARLADNPQSWLISEDPDVPLSISDWLVSDLLDIQGASIQSVSITHPDGELIQVSKPEQDAGNYEFSDIPEGRELQYEGIGNGIANTLQDLRLEDVAEASPTNEPGTVTKFSTFDGLHVTVTSYERDGETWSRFKFDRGMDTPSPEIEDESQATDEVAEGSDEVEEAAEASEIETSEVASSDSVAETDAGEGESEEQAVPLFDAEAANQRMAGWEYKLPSAKTDVLTRRWEEVLQEEPTEEPGEEPADDA
jgi:hypothetical protein